MNLILAILKAITTAFDVFKQERSIYNNPDVAKAKLQQQIQDDKDRIAKANAVLANPNSTLEQHAAALRELRLGMS